MHTAAKGDKALCRAEGHALNNISAFIFRFRSYSKAQVFEKGGCENGGLHSLAHNMGSGEKPHIQLSAVPEGSARLAPNAGAGKPVGAFFYKLVSARNISARGGNSAAGVFNKRAGNNIRANLARLLLFGKFTVAVIHHYNALRGDLTHNVAQLADFLYCKAGSCAVPARALNVRHFVGICGKLLFYCRFIGRAVGQQRYFVVFNPEISKGTVCLFVNSENARNGVVRSARKHQNLIARAQKPEKRHR